jgi:hypothetical protein
VAGGGGPDLRPGEKRLPAAQVSTGHACDAPRDTGRSQNRLAGDGLLWTIKHRFYRAGESDCPPWSGSFGASQLGHCPAGPTPPGASSMVASLLSFCASPCIAPGDARAAARARWQAGGATLPATHPSNGSGENQPTLVNAGSPVLSLAASAMLHHLSVNGARRHPVNGSEWLGEDESRDGTGCLQDEVAYLFSRMGVKPVRNEFAEPVRIIHHIQWLYRSGVATALLCSFARI